MTEHPTGAYVASDPSVTWEFYDKFTAFPHTALHRTDRHVVAEVQIIEACPDGGCVGEFTISWHHLSPGYYPRLTAFADAWGTLQRSGVLDLLRGLDRPSPDAVMQRLREAGYADRTAPLAVGMDSCPTCHGLPFHGPADVRRAREQMAASDESGASDV